MLKCWSVKQKIELTWALGEKSFDWSWAFLTFCCRLVSFRCMTRTAIPDDVAGVPTGESAAEDEPLPYDLKSIRESIWIASSISLMLSRRYLLIGSTFCYQKKRLKFTKKDLYLPCRISFSASSSFRSPRLRYCMPDGAEGMGPGVDIASGSIPSSSRVVAASTATWTTAGAWVGTTFGVQSPARTKGAVCQRFNMDEFCKKCFFFLVRRKIKRAARLKMFEFFGLNFVVTKDLQVLGQICSAQCHRCILWWHPTIPDLWE